MRATITLTVKTTGNAGDIDEKFGGQTVTLSTSVMPRRHVWSDTHRATFAGESRAGTAQLRPSASDSPSRACVRFA
jgi:hypothetical protein